MAPFSLPDETTLAPVLQSFPCRERQIHSLATLFYPSAAPARNVVLHGTSATGKSGVTSLLLHHLSSSTSHLRHSVINAATTITGRHLYESMVASVASALQWQDGNKRVETLAALTVELCRMLKYEDRGEGFRFVLVVDGVDKAREGGPWLLAALTRLSEIIPCLTTVFILTAPSATALYTPSTAALHFPPYTKPDLVQILSLSPPPTIPNANEQETLDLWTRFCAAVHDALVKPAARSLPAFKGACDSIWPKFVDPIEKGTYQAKEFSKLLVAARSHFQDENVLNPSIVSVRPASTETSKPSADLSALLPRTARMLLLCAYLAAHNAAKHDITLFSTYHNRQRRRRAVHTTQKHRKISRKLLGAHAFVLERMLAIFAAVRTEWLDDSRLTLGRAGLDGDVGMALATLANLRLLSRVGGTAGGDIMDRGGKWRVNVGWEVVRGLGRSLGVEVEEWLID